MITSTRVTAVAFASTLVTACAALAQPHHQEIMCGVDAAGQLHMHHHAVMPFVLPPSPFPGIDGYAQAEVALSSLDVDHPAIGLFTLPQTVDIRAVLVSQSPGMQVFGGITPLPIGGELVLGAPVIHYMPIWNITQGQPGEVKDIALYFRDASGQFQDSEVFTLQFQVVPTPATAMVLVAGILPICRRRRRRR